MRDRLTRDLLPGRAGCGIAVRGNDLVAVVARAGRAGIHVLGRAELRSFRERPPADWGAEYASLLKSAGQRRASATLALPRSEVVFRVLSLPPMKRADLARAIDLQLQDLHPYGDAPVCCSFSPIGGAGGDSRQHVAVAIAPDLRIESYASRLSEAGIAVSACTVSADALRSAARQGPDAGSAPFLLVDRHGSTLEIYGASATVPLLSSALHLDGVAAEGALRLAREGLGETAGRNVAAACIGASSEEFALPGIETVPAETLLAAPQRQAGGFDLKRDAVALGAALLSAGSGPAPGLNLLPARARKRASIAPRLALGGGLAATALLLAVAPAVRDRRYAQRLIEETARLEQAAARLAGGAASAAALQERYNWLLERRERIRRDLDAIQELAEILPESAWLTALRLEPDTAVLTGVAADADPLVSLLSSSPRLEQARFVRSPAGGAGGEQFQIEARRR
ncbi:MAG: PilN domain-containing protein [Bryobacterales bacterium]|nr:PilN domain-containing protein [Bryobacterales bacterium]